MTPNFQRTSPLLLARLAGLLYLIIIISGLFSEIIVRSSLITTGDPAGTAANIAASPGLFRIGFLADSVMILSDVALAALFYILLRPVSKVVSLTAACLRLGQAVVLALNLLHYYAAILVLNGSIYSKGIGPEGVNALAYLLLELHGHGYDLGLLLFGVHCILLGWLIHKSGFLPKALGILVAAAGFAYLIGGYTRFLFPDYIDAVSMIYAVPVVSEVSLCLWLLIKGVNPVQGRPL